MKPTVMFSYNNGKGSSIICDALNIKRLKHHGTHFVATPRHVCINWGGHDAIPVRAGRFGRVLNEPNKVAASSNKQVFFHRCAQNGDAPRVPEHTTNPDVAAQWLRAGTTVVERHTVHGQAGAGIRIVEPGGRIQVAPLYTKYINKDAEYRVHVVGGKVIFKQQKVKRDGINVRDEFVRSLHNGYIFREKVKDNMPDDVLVQAVKAVKHMNLDFGAVDIVSKRGVAYVLEVNSAPGIDPNSRLPAAYAAAFREYIGD